MGIERQESLESLQQIHGKTSRQIENEQSPGVCFPGHFLFLIDPAASVNPSFQGTGESAQEDGFPRIDSGHVAPQGYRRGDKRDEIERNLKDSVGGHENTSGLSKAMKR